MDGMDGIKHITLELTNKSMTKHGWLNALEQRRTEQGGKSSVVRSQLLKALELSV